MFAQLRSAHLCGGLVCLTCPLPLLSLGGLWLLGALPVWDLFPLLRAPVFVQRRPVRPWALWHEPMLPALPSGECRPGRFLGGLGTPFPPVVPSGFWVLSEVSAGG